MGIEPGAKFGRLTVLAEAPKSGRQKKWHCQCDCGKQTTSFAFSLKAGQSKSCGCIAAEKSKERWANPTPEMREKLSKASTNASHRMSKHPAYRSWADMKQRCTVTTNAWYPSYGGRGIKVDQGWLDSFEIFWQDMGESWFKGGQLGRKDNDGDYCKENCAWETPTEQMNNRSNSIAVETPEGIMTVAEASAKYNLSIGCISYRLAQGFSPEQLVKPSQRSK